MKKILTRIFGTVLLLGLVMGTSIASAHTMTLAEVTLRNSSGDEIKIGMTLGAVTAIMGDNCKLQAFAGDGIRMTKYVYSDGTTFYGRTSQRDSRVDEEVTMNGYTIKTAALQTASGIAVGQKYSEIEEKFGPGEKLKPKYESTPGLTTYIYDLYKGVRQLSLKVDNEGIVKVIAFRQEM